jgi:hypothetical protein
MPKSAILRWVDDPTTTSYLLLYESYIKIDTVRIFEFTKKSSLYFLRILDNLSGAVNE